MKLIKLSPERISIAGAILGRSLLAITSAFGIATTANWANHKGYWEGTIVRVQTTDFNILSHTLPTKLSYALQKRDYVELQRTLNSNYGLFGIVVTNCTTTAIECPTQKILHITESTKSWREQLKIQDLSQHPYDLLRDPPPLVTEGGFEDSRDQTWNVPEEGSIDKVNPGRIIGRVYYIRGIPPEFWTDYSGWLEKLPGSLLSNSGAHKYYTLTVSLFLSSGFAAWGFVEWALSQKRLQKRLAQQEEQRLLKEAQQLRNQLLRQLQRQEILLAELNSYRSEQTQVSHSLAQKVIGYEDGLKQKGLEQHHHIQNLKNLEFQLQEIQRQQVEGQEQLQKREQSIADLQARIATQQREKQQTDGSLKQLQHNLQITQRKLAGTSNRVQNLNKSIVSLTEERDTAQQQIKQLEAELKAVRTQAANTTALAETLATSKANSERSQQRAVTLERQAKELENYVVEENEQLNNKLIQLEHDNFRLEDECFHLQTQVQQLEEQLELFRSKRIDLSNLTLALVGGYPDLRRDVVKRLQKEYGLQSANTVPIPPASERRIDQAQLRAKIANCALVVVFTEYCDHSLYYMLSNLNEKKALAGKVMPTDCRGKNAAIRSIMGYVMDHPELLAR